MPELVVQGELDFDAVPWIAVGSLGRHVLNERHSEAFRKWFPGLRLPVGLLGDLAAVVEDYARVAVREASSGTATGS